MLLPKTVGWLKKIDAAPTPDRSVILNSLRDPKSGKL